MSRRQQNCTPQRSDAAYCRAGHSSSAPGPCLFCTLASFQSSCAWVPTGNSLVGPWRAEGEGRGHVFWLKQALDGGRHTRRLAPRPPCLLHIPVPSPPALPTHSLQSFHTPTHLAVHRQGGNGGCRIEPGLNAVAQVNKVEQRKRGVLAELFNSILCLWWVYSSHRFGATIPYASRQEEQSSLPLSGPSCHTAPPRLCACHLPTYSKTHAQGVACRHVHTPSAPGKRRPACQGFAESARRPRSRPTRG